VDRQNLLLMAWALLESSTGMLSFVLIQRISSAFKLAFC
jgi:hypothetical protein